MAARGGGRRGLLVSYSVGDVIFKHGRDEVVFAGPTRAGKSEDCRGLDTWWSVFDCLQPDT